MSLSSLYKGMTGFFVAREAIRKTNQHDQMQDGRTEAMLGIPDASIWLAYVLSIGGAALCIAYGIIHWNKDGGDSAGGDGK